MKALVAATLFFSSAVSAFGAEAWNCQFPGHGGIWQIAGSELIAPAASGSTRFPIVQQSDDAVIALSGEFQGRHFEMVTFDRRRQAMRILRFDLDGSPDQQEAGQCTRPSAGAVAAARAVEESVRPRIRALVQQAQNLASQGYTSAANLKLSEARTFDRITPEETQLIGQTQTYVSSKPRR